LVLKTVSDDGFLRKWRLEIIIKNNLITNNKNKMTKQKGNIAVITIIIVIVGITVAVFTWNFAKKSQIPSIQSTVVPAKQQSVQSVADNTQSPTLGITEKTINDFSKIGYSNWKTYSLKTLQFDLPSIFFDKEVVQAPENFKIIQSASLDLKKNNAYIGSIGCEDNDCQYDGGTDGYVNIFSYIGKTPLDVLKEVCKEIASDLLNVSCAPKKFILASGLEAYELGLEENYWSVGSGAETYVFSIGNSSGVV
jgi:hypothetical protein